MSSRNFVKCRYCEHKLSRPITKPKEDFVYVDRCHDCKRYLCITIHPDGSYDMIECSRDYEPPTTKSIQQ